MTNLAQERTYVQKQHRPAHKKQLLAVKFPVNGF